MEMHDCLQVGEIVDLIFTLIYKDSPARVGMQDLISLALTCRRFQETALDILWHTQTSLVPLIKTLPHRCWSEPFFDPFDRTFELTHQKPDEEELMRFAFYARRIRRIKYLPYAFHRQPHYDLKALRVIWSDRVDKTRPVFPNLLRVEFVNIKDAAPCLDIFLESKSISLSLYWSASDGSITRLFPIIEQHALNMEELDLGALQDSENVDCEHLSHLVSKMTDLRRLSCGSRILDRTAIQHLSSLPYLRNMQVANTSRCILDSLHQGSFSGMPFPQLQHLIMPEVDLRSFINLIKQLRPLQLQDLTLQLSTIPSSTKLHASFMALEEASSQLSTFVRIKITIKRTRFGHAPVNKTVLINGHVLEPLLSFRNLAVLELDIPCPFDLGDTQLIAMADAWPRLTRLRLGDLGGWHLPHLITFNGFLRLLRGCPGLEYLVFAFNASSEVPLISDIPAACINKNITYLYVGDSRIGANRPELVAGFLARVLPNLCGIGGAWLQKADQPNSKKWGEVLDAAKASLR